MIGAGQDRAETRRLAAGNQRGAAGSTGSTPPTCRPLVAGHDVCLGIFGTGAEGAAGGAEQGLPGRRRRLRGRHLGHPRRSGRRSATPPCSCRPATPARSPRRCARSPPTAPAAGQAAGRAPDRARERFAPAVVVTALRERLLGVVPGGPGTALTAAALPPLAPRAWLRWDVVDRLRRRLGPATCWRSAAARAALGARLAQRYHYPASSRTPSRARWPGPGSRRRRRGPPAATTGGPGRPRGSTWCARSRCSSTSRTTPPRWPTGLRTSAPAASCCSRCRRANRGSARPTCMVGHFRRYDPDRAAAAAGGAGLVDVADAGTTAGRWATCSRRAATGWTPGTSRGGRRCGRRRCGRRRADAGAADRRERPAPAARRRPGRARDRAGHGAVPVSAAARAGPRHRPRRGGDPAGLTTRCGWADRARRRVRARAGSPGPAPPRSARRPRRPA